MTSAILSRKHNQDDYLIDIAVQKKLEDEDNTEIDSYANLVDEIRDHFCNINFPLIPAQWFAVANEPIYAVEHLDQFRQFTSIITLSYRVMYDPYNLHPPISNLQLWLDSSDASTVITASPVAQWDTKAGNDNAEQNNASFRPDYVLAGQNGLNIIRFDGIDNYMFIDDASELESDDFTVYFVAKQNSTSAFLSLQANLQSGFRSGVIIFSSTNMIHVLTAENGTDQHLLVSSNSPDTDWHVFSITKNGTNMIVRMDGQQIGSANDAPATINYSVLAATVIGGDATGGSVGSEMDGDYGEILHYTEAHDNSIVQAVENRLMGRWL